MKSLKLKTKLLYLLLLVGFGLVVVGLIGYINIQNIKRNMDTLYFGSLLPLSELNSISSIYHNDLASSVYQWSNQLLSDEQASQNIVQGLDRINTLWGSYISHHKRPEEMAYVKYTEGQIQNIGNYFIQVRSLINDPDRSHPLSLMSMDDNLQSIHTTLQQLITYENAVAKYEHSMLLTQYENALIQLVFFLGVILALVMGLAWTIFARIEVQQQQLIASSETLKHLNLKLEQASYTDSLTGMFNRRYFNIVYEREFKRALRSNNPFVFMMLDIDYFKQYNDTYGHLQGDVALQAVAKVLKTTLQRPGDYPFRLGGEEFGIILTDIDCNNARSMGEKVREGIENLKIEHKGSKILPTLSISIGGICITPTVDMSEDALIHAADTNLYAAKERGRNQVMFSNKL
ncbi:MAG: diguanylate cyclase [Sulfuricurvum sp.]|uniref:diguanylate cyclase domain-containing protein n=1 Tax=Sulfuricurvum sp. TaxID=2025608 RepID=UPI0027334A7F|nr:diguanylate cyclase [Sulfuricurvum sp.]MDP2849710.1 diguanylate cyclase [Sulfuricurvum sp.]MDP3291701.1 diguanylate cyclase [Sulfuricurvum sp.]